MQTVHQPVIVRLAATAPSNAAADILFVLVFENEAGDVMEALDAATGGEIGRARGRGEFLGKAFETFFTPVTPGAGSAARIGLVGAGPVAEWGRERARRCAAVAGLAARQRRVPRIAIAMPRVGQNAGDLQAAAEGVCLANYDGGAYKTNDRPRQWLESADLIVKEASGGLNAAVERGRVLGECTNAARALSNEPGNALTPTIFAERAADLGRAAGLTVEILDEEKITALKMGLLLGVSRGSQEPPRLIVLRHEPSTASGPVLGLVGKGVTFDTGGISIKPAENMDKMKDDMSGGAAVIAAMTALSILRAPVRVIGVVPAVENMPGGRAIKPGDVLRGASGKTVEVLNTDAEGRLILGDALWYARQLGATHLVDVATLTGAITVALGKTTAGLFGTPDWWLEEVRQASHRAGDRSWPMPLFADYFDQIKSEIADMTNTGGRMGGAITAALFLKEFADGVPWVHMDIAGTAWAEEAKPYQPKGATGAAVRTLAELALGVDAWRKLT
jgi:leucyl aminopeptidase